LKQLKRYITLLLIIICCAANTLNAQKFKIQQYNQAHLIDKSMIYDFCQDVNLNFYFGTDKGLLLYDGQEFNPVDFLGNVPLPNAVKNISYLDYHIYFTHENTLYDFFQADSTIREVMQNQTINKLSAIKNHLYFSTNEGLYKLENTVTNKIDTIYYRDNIKINDWNISDDYIVIGSTEGLHKLDRANGVQETIGSYLNSLKLVKNSDSTFFILGQLRPGVSGIYRFDYNNIIKETDVSINNPKDIYYSNIGNIWIGNAKGDIQIYNGFTTRKFESDNKYTRFPINIFKEDNEGNLWIIGDKSIMSVGVNGAFTQEEFSGISAISFNDNDVVFIGDKKIKIVNPISTNQIYEIPNNFKVGSRPAPFFYNDIWYVNGEKQFLTVSQDVISTMERPESFSLISKIGLNTYGINNEGLFQLNERFEILSKKNDLIGKDKVKWDDNALYLLKENKDLFVYKADTVHSFSLSGMPEINLQHLKFGNDKLWAFYKDQIIIKMPGGEMRQISLTDLLERPDLRIYTIFLDSKQNLWVSINSEIIRFAYSESERNVKLQLISSYTVNDNIYASYFNDAKELADGTIYFIHNNNLTIFNPLLENSSLIKPGVRLNDIYAFSYDRFNNPNDTINLNTTTVTALPFNSSVHIKATSITTINKNKSQIKYRIEGINQDWLYIDNNNLISIFDLPSGENIILIKSVNVDGMESEEEISINILVAPPFWQEYWFYVILIVLFLLIAFVIYRGLNNFKDNKTKELHEKLDKELNDLEKRSHLQILKAERLKQLNELITSQKSELEKKNTQIESQKYELSLTTEQIKKQKDLLEQTSTKLKASINYAQRIQNALMSTEIEIKEAIDESFVYFQPRDVVSGDFYWFNKVIDENGDELLILAAVDCTGHGVPGAIVSVVGMSLLNTITNLKGLNDPGEILFELNKDIITNLRQSETLVNDGMDMTIVSINPKTKEIKFAGAKNPLMYVENGELIRIRGDKFAIGGQQREKDRNYVTHTIAPTDAPRMYFLFSDGYQDQFGGEKGFKFLTSNFKALLLEIHDKPVIDQKDILYNRINNWKGDFHQTDDMLVIGFRL
jgi:serine phosphatase RsbU (regulator of sigma subunit)